ncbi:AraC-like ligand-binding domain-containing protein [Actinomadura montaniterrae]|uniref:Transcription regulator HTH AraC- type ligand binding domain-containing protein n=1 Tax=Actinomadura montaniterrae TaxID=1803903 RepID=A0A6L3W2Y4_9ACTN|nr:hypothetical protein F9B16_08940 [Actinomadura montaniterrae]
MIRQYSGDDQLVSYWSSEARYVRTPGLVRREPDEAYRLLIPLRGEIGLITNGGEVALRPGMGALWTFTEPFRLAQPGHDSRCPPDDPRPRGAGSVPRQPNVRPVQGPTARRWPTASVGPSAKSSSPCNRPGPPHAN